MQAPERSVQGERYNLRPYPISLAIAIAAWLLRDLIEKVTEAPSPYLLSVAAVAVSAWYGGFRPGLFTTAILCLAGIFHAQPPGAPINTFIRPISYVVTSFAVCFVVRELRSARRRAEKTAVAAEAAERALHAVLESTHDAVISLDEDFRCTYVNEKAARQIGQSVPELVGRKPWEVLPQLGGSNAMEILRRAATERRATCFEERFFPTAEWFEWNVYPAASGLNLFVRDITAQKNSQVNRAALTAEIEIERARLANVLHHMPVAVVLISSDLTIEVANPRAEELFGEVRPGRDFQTVRNGVFRTAEGRIIDHSGSPVAQTLRTGQAFPATEMEYIPPRGAVLSLIVTCIPLKDRDGRVRAVIATYSDVTSLRSTQAALAASEHQLRSLFRSPSMGIFAGDGETITDANAAFLSMLGYTLEELSSGVMKWRELTPRDFSARDAKAINQLIERGFCEPYEKEYIARDGRRVPVLIGIVSTRPGAWTPWVVWVLDLTERRRLEEDLRQHAKLESIGVLAGGVAHDFNNLLTSILGNTALAAEMLPEGNSTRELLDNAILATERAADLTRQLLAYAGKGNVIVRPVEVSRLVSETFNILHASIPDNVQCSMHLASGLPMVGADATQVQQLVMNLMINAGEAIPDGAAGRVDISTAAVHIQPDGLPDALKNAWVDGELLPGSYVSIEVKDNGCGMDEETRRQIFDPFFTTKFTGRGLGLAAALGIARSHNGAIAVRTAPGQGSSFQVLLPVAPVANEPPGRGPNTPELAITVH